MRETTLAGVTLKFEAAEAGGRYLAPILILPGLFQSWSCWRGVTSMLAHRGWNVYLMPRSTSSHADANGGGGWEEALATTVRVASNLDSKLIVFGADIGAALALASAPEVRPLALALFAPAKPSHTARNYHAELGFFERQRARGQLTLEAPASLRKQATRQGDPGTEPKALLNEDVAEVAGVHPLAHPPALVFIPNGDPLVDSTHAASFANTAYAKPARARLAGRWWPSSRWEPIVDEAHRFLILTLADRVVEFPDEIIED